MDLDLAQLRAFVAVADHGRMGQAAASLHLTQQAVSRRIALLERQLGRLFDRGPGGLVLTARGAQLLPRARHLLESAQAMVDSTARTPQAPLRVDVWGPWAAPAGLVHAFAAARPDVLVEPSMRRNLLLAVAALQRHEVDVAFGNAFALPGPLPEILHARLVTTSQVCALVPEGAVPASGSLAAADLAGRELWLPERSSSPEPAAFVAEYAAAVGATAAAAPHPGPFRILREIVDRPERVALADGNWPVPAGSGVAMVPIRPVPLFPWCAVWRADAVHEPVADLLQDLVRHAHAEGRLPTTGDGWWMPAAARAALDRGGTTSPPTPPPATG